ncbi:MAG: hypothetical protein IPI12_16025 [Ignavibacteriales bacterium]|nr:hypothetical protein [Ignavibacteriales bacterium]
MNKRYNCFTQTKILFSPEDKRFYEKLSTHILIALLAVISFNFNIIGQSDSLKKEENKEAKVEYYKVDEIPK